MIVPDEDSMVVPDEDFTDTATVRAATEDFAATRIFGETWKGQNNASLLEVQNGGEEFRPKAWVTKLSSHKVKLGAGAFGTVFGVKAKCDPSAEFAVKIQRAHGKQPHILREWMQDMRQEVKMMEALNTARFVQILGHTEGPDLKDRFPRYSILMEKASGSLDKFTQPGGYKATFTQTATFFAGMLEGLAYMHSKNFVHRDLKPANVLISCPDAVMKELKTGSSSKSGVCNAKIADLGLTCTLKKSCSGVAGTPLYMPPELLAKRTIDFSNDVWALGIIFYELVLRTLPTPLKQARTIEDLNRKIIGLKVVMSVSDIQRGLGISDAAEAGKVKALIEGMLIPDMGARLTASAALALAKQLKVGSIIFPPAATTLPPCWDGKQPEPEPAPKKPAAPEPEPEPELEDADNVDLGNIQSDSDEDFFVVKAKRAGGDVGVNFIVNWVLGDLDYAKLIKVDYVKGLLPKRMYAKKFAPVEVNGIPVAELRKDKIRYADLLKNGLMGEAVVIKVVTA